MPSQFPKNADLSPIVTSDLVQEIVPGSLQTATSVTDLGSNFAEQRASSISPSGARFAERSLKTELLRRLADPGTSQDPKLEEIAMQTVQRAVRKNSLGEAIGVRRSELSSVAAEALIERMKSYNQRELVSVAERVEIADEVELPISTALQIDGEFLNANYVHLRSATGEKIIPPLAIVSAIPDASIINYYTEMLFREKPSLIAVMVDESELSEEFPDYFRQDGSYGEIDAQAQHAVDLEIFPDTVPDRDASTTPLKLKCYLLSLIKEKQEEVCIPVLHLQNCPAGTVISTAHMDLLLGVARSFENRDSTAQKRVPLVQSKTGLNRAGQFVVAYALSFHQQAKSAEQVLQDIRYFRGKQVANTPEQQMQIGDIAAAHRLPTTATPIHQPLLVGLRHLGYSGASLDTHLDIRQAFRQLKLSEAITRPKQGEELTKILSAQKQNLPLVIDIETDSGLRHQAVWRAPAQHAGIDLQTGQSCAFSPSAYWKAKILGQQVSVKNIELSYLLEDEIP